MPGFARKIMGTSFVQSMLKAQVDRMPEGPSEEVLRTGKRVLVGVVTTARGETACARRTGECAAGVHVAKPASPDALVATVADLLKF